MPTPFIMPKFDMDQETATVIEWLKEEGDFVKYDEDVLIVETEKVAIEVPSPAEGILSGVFVEPGDIVPVTTVIAYILAEGETEADIPGDVKGSALQQDIDEVQVDDSSQPSIDVLATPVAARTAQKLGIDLAKIVAKGERISKDDIERHRTITGRVEKENESAPSSRITVPATPAARRLARELHIDIAQVSGTGPRNRVQVADIEAAANSSLLHHRNAEEIPLSGIRKTIADRMETSFSTAPHIALTVEVDVTNLERSRRKLNEMTQEEDGIIQGKPATDSRISLTAMLVHATASALSKHPFVNASLDDGTILLWKEVNVGVATAIDGGLVVPVIHDCDKLSLDAINIKLEELSVKARNGQLKLSDVKNGTFTLSNLGMFGIDQFRAIINPPESAILAVGRVVRKPVVVNQQDDVRVRSMMSITLSADHRVVDGVTAANFLTDLVSALEHPDKDQL